MPVAKNLDLHRCQRQCGKVQLPTSRKHLFQSRTVASRHSRYRHLMRVSDAYMEATKREQRDAKGMRQCAQNPGSGLVLDPAKNLRPGRTGEEFYLFNFMGQHFTLKTLV